MLTAQPSKTYRGTIDEVFSHRDDIPPNAMLELRVFDPIGEDSIGDYGGKSAADIVCEIGFVHGGPSDLATNPQHMAGFGKTRSVRDIAR